MKGTFFSEKAAHTEAKLELYKDYLENYLFILANSKYINNIIVCDLFSGTGIYKDGSDGSPIIAYKAIEKVLNSFKDTSGPQKKISLILNEYNNDNYKTLTELLPVNDLQENFKILIHNYNFNSIKSKLIDELNNLDNNTRALIFLDPFGYKDIRLNIIDELLNNKKTEIFLFLPTSDIYRFRKPAQLSDDVQYKAIKELANEIFELTGDYISSTNNEIEFISCIRNALTLNSKYYACSHYLEKSKGHFYAVFFITSHIYGLDRMLYIKWNADPEFGKGSRNIETNRDTLFNNFNFIESEIDRLLIKIIPTDKFISNCELYEQILINQYIPKIVIPIIKQAINRDLDLYDINRKKLDKVPRGFYLNYDNYKNKPKLFFKRRGD